MARRVQSAIEWDSGFEMRWTRRHEVRTCISHFKSKLVVLARGGLRHAGQRTADCGDLDSLWSGETAGAQARHSYPGCSPPKLHSSSVKDLRYLINCAHQSGRDMRQCFGGSRCNRPDHTRTHLRRPFALAGSSNTQDADSRTRRDDRRPQQHRLAGGWPAAAARKAKLAHTPAAAVRMVAARRRDLARILEANGTLSRPPLVRSKWALVGRSCCHHMMAVGRPLGQAHCASQTDSAESRRLGAMRGGERPFVGYCILPTTAGCESIGATTCTHTLGAL